MSAFVDVGGEQRKVIERVLHLPHYDYSSNSHSKKGGVR
jgi:hypothetical protein